MQEKQPQSQSAAPPQAKPDWNKFLRILAPQFIDLNTEIFMSKEAETISFDINTARLEEFQQHFERILQSSESLEQQLSYKKVYAVPSSPSFTEIQPLDRPSIENLEQAKKFMKKLFGADTMEGRSDFPLNLDHLFASYENSVLISQSQRWATYELAKEEQKFLCAHLNGVNVQDLRQIIAGNDDQHLQAPDPTVMDAGQGEGFVQTCFGIYQDNIDPKAPTFRIYFNIGRFLQLVYPPKVHVQEMAESKTRVTISASHLLLYVKQLSRHGILFTVELNHGNVSAQPLVLPHKEMIQKPLTVFIVLDDSTSMKYYRYNLFENVAAFIERIALVAPEADIRITIFSSHNRRKESRQKAKDFNARQFINQSPLSGDTALFNVLSDTLNKIQPILNTDNTMLILFTDGKNNDSWVNEETITDQITSIATAVKDGAMPPEIYPIGCGEVDEVVLNKLAKAALHEQYIKLKSMQDLEGIMRGIEGFEYGRVAATFMKAIDGTTEEVVLPIRLDGQPKVVHQVTIPLSSKPVKVSFQAPTKGQELAWSGVTLQITKSQAQETMEEYKQQVMAVYDRASESPAKKIAQLYDILEQVNRFCSKAPREIVLALQTDLQQKIKEYHEALLKEQDRFSSSSETSTTPSAVSPSLGRDSPINSGTINRSVRTEEKEKNLPTPR